jgi:nucleotide-binding universal stress UspA family protein
VSITRIIVGVSGSLGNLSALHAAVAEARHREASLLAVRAWTPHGGELSHRRGPLLAEWRREESLALRTAFIDAFGAMPDDVEVRTSLVRGEAGPALVRVADQPGDLLVVGAGRPGRISRIWRGAVSRYCLAHARCKVLSVPQPDLTRDLRRLRRARLVTAPI